VDKNIDIVLGRRRLMGKSILGHNEDMFKEGDRK